MFNEKKQDLYQKLNKTFQNRTSKLKNVGLCWMEEHEEKGNVLQQQTIMIFKHRSKILQIHVFENINEYLWLHQDCSLWCLTK